MGCWGGGIGVPIFLYGGLGSGKSSKIKTKQVLPYIKRGGDILIIPFFKGAGKTITNTATCTDGSCTTTTAEEANTLGIIIINETNGSNNNNVAMATAGRRKKSMYSSLLDNAPY